MNIPKTREEIVATLSSEKQACLDMFRNGSTSSNISLAIIVGQSIEADIEAEIEKHTPWKPKWLANKGSTVVTVACTRHTFEDSERALKMQTELDLINRWIYDENHRTGYVADWSDKTKLKHSVRYNNNIKWSVVSAYSYQTPGIEYCGKWAAEMLVDLLNNNMIAGISREVNIS